VTKACGVHTKSCHVIEAPGRAYSLGSFSFLRLTLWHRRYRRFDIPTILNLLYHFRLPFSNQSSISTLWGISNKNELSSPGGVELTGSAAICCLMCSSAAASVFAILWRTGNSLSWSVGISSFTCPLTRRAPKEKVEITPVVTPAAEAKPQLCPFAAHKL
jgi:hypothetical protein